jgi:tRNA nucleotidyltransferase (CCA-adding enzyme)
VNDSLKIKDNQVSLVESGIDIIKDNPRLLLHIMYIAIENGLSISEQTLDIINKTHKLVGRIPVEIVTEDLRKMLCCGKPISRTFKECASVICDIFPHMEDCVGFTQNKIYHIHTVYEHLLAVTDYCESTKFEVKLAALLHDIGKPSSYGIGLDGRGHFYGHPKESYDICKKELQFSLRLTSSELDRVLELVLNHDSIITCSTKGVRKILNLHSLSYVEDWVALKKADLDDHINLQTSLLKYNTDEVLKLAYKIDRQNKEFKVSNLAIDGNDIKRIAYSGTGKHIGIILNTLKDEVLAGKVSNNNKALIERALELWYRKAGGLCGKS